MDDAETTVDESEDSAEELSWASGTSDAPDGTATADPDEALSEDREDSSAIAASQPSDAIESPPTSDADDLLFGGADAERPAEEAVAADLSREAMEELTASLSGEAIEADGPSEARGLAEPTVGVDDSQDRESPPESDPPHPLESLLTDPAPGAPQSDTVETADESPDTTSSNRG